MRLSSPFAAAVVVLSSLTNLGCSDGRRSTYYPLEEGRKWSYKLTVAIQGKGLLATTRERTVFSTLTNLPERQIQGKDATPQKMDANGDTSFSFVVSDDSGVYEVATQSSRDVEPKTNTDPSYLFKRPISVGTTWIGSTRSQYMDVYIPTETVIESTDAVVTVTSGTFENCIRLKTVGSHEEKSEGPFGLLHEEKVSLEEFTWFAEGVGLIRAMIKETLVSRTLDESSKKEIDRTERTAEITLELESFED